MQVGILTISDRAYAKQYDDQSGPIIQSIIEERLGWKVVQTGVVPDEREYIKSELTRWVDDLHLNLILTTGGTGFSPRDITPEATRDVIEREAPGMAEALRAESLKITPHAMLSRGVCGIRGQTLIINLPGSPKAVSENMDVLLPVLPHALDLLTGSPDAETGHRKV